jgi:hypothetical protein
MTAELGKQRIDVRGGVVISLAMVCPRRAADCRQNWCVAEKRKLRGTT